VFEEVKGKKLVSLKKYYIIAILMALIVSPAIMSIGFIVGFIISGRVPK